MQNIPGTSTQLNPGTQGVKRRRVSGEDIQNMAPEDARKKLAEYANELAAHDELEAQLAAGSTGGTVTALPTGLNLQHGSVMERLLLKILNELQETRVDLNKYTQERATDKATIDSQQKEINRLNGISYQHQRFMEQIDAQNRVNNVVIMGIPEDPAVFGGETNDTAKIKRLFGEIGAQDTVIIEFKRLGDKKDNRIRPILMKSRSREARDALLEKAKALKEKEEPYKTVYIKKDVHPLVRQEWKRLKDLEKSEKEKAENSGHTIVLDSKNRTLLRDGQIIDRWQPNFF